MVDAAVPGESKRTEIITPTLSGTFPGGVILYLKLVLPNSLSKEEADLR